jgi:hypothetical protein
MTIHFKNGKTLDIPKEYAEVLYTRLESGCKNWQLFKNEKSEILLMLNLENINYII